MRTCTGRSCTGRSPPARSTHHVTAQRPSTRCATSDLCGWRHIILFFPPQHWHVWPQQARLALQALDPVRMPACACATCALVLISQFLRCSSPAKSKVSPSQADPATPPPTPVSPSQVDDTVLVTPHVVDRMSQASRDGTDRSASFVLIRCFAFSDRSTAHSELLKHLSESLADPASVPVCRLALFHATPLMYFRTERIPERERQVHAGLVRARAKRQLHQYGALCTCDVQAVRHVCGAQVLLTRACR